MSARLKKAKATAVKVARARLRVAIDRCCLARGEAQWVNGYRCGNPEKEAELHAKEMKAWARCGEVEKALERYITAYGTAKTKAAK